MVELVGWFSAGTVGAAWLTIGRGTIRFRRQTSWLVRPRAERVGPGAYVAGLSPVLAEVCDELRRLGFEPVVTTRTLLGVWAGLWLWRFRVTTVQPRTGDSAVVVWEQRSSDRRTTWASGLDLYFIRGTETTDRRTTQVHVAAWAADRGRYLVRATDAGAVTAAYGRLVADPRPAVSWPYPDVASFLAARDAATADQMAAAMGTDARPDRSGRSYVYTWPAAFRIVFRHWTGTGRQPSAARGFEVLPVATAAGSD